MGSISMRSADRRLVGLSDRSEGRKARRQQPPRTQHRDRARPVSFALAIASDTETIAVAVPTAYARAHHFVRLLCFSFFFLVVCSVVVVCLCAMRRDGKGKLSCLRCVCIVPEWDVPTDQTTPIEPCLICLVTFRHGWGR